MHIIMTVDVEKCFDIALDWAVSMAQGRGRIYDYAPSKNDTHYSEGVDYTNYFYITHPYNTGPYHPSTKWEDGGPIIQEHKITIDILPDNGWRAYNRKANVIVDSYEQKASPLLVAMRCFVIMKCGNIITLPDKRLLKWVGGREEF